MLLKKKFATYLFLILLGMLASSVSLYSQCSVSYTTSDTICTGDTLDITISVTGSSGPYSWKLDQALPAVGPVDSTSVANSISIFPTNNNPYALLYIYAFNVFDSAGTGCNSGYIQILVNPKPTISVTSSKSNVCLGDTLALTAHPSAYSYQWATDATLSNLNIQSPIAQPTNTNHTYYVMITNPSTGCSQSDSITVSVWPVINNVSVGFSASQDSLCSGSEINFTSSVVGGTNPFSYFWDFGDGDSANTVYVDHTFDTTGCGYTSFDVELTVVDDNGCSATSGPNQIIVKRRPDPIFTDSNSFTRCNSSLPFPVKASNDIIDTSCIQSYTVDWGDSSGILNLTNANFHQYDTHTYDKGTYQLEITVTNDNGCQSVFQQNVAHEDVPTFSLNASVNYACYPDTFTIQLDSFVQNTPGTTYEIDFDDGTVVIYDQDSMLQDSGFIQHVYYSNSCNGTQSGNTYFEVEVQATNSCGYSLIKPTFFVWGPPEPEFEVIPQPPCSGMGPFCSNCDVCFANITDNSYYGQNCGLELSTYYWDFGDGTDTVMYTRDTICKSYPPGSYTITLAVTNSCGSDTTKQDILVVSADNAFADADYDSADCAPHTVTFTNLSVGDSLEYQWIVDPAYGWNYVYPSTDSSENPTIQFVDTGVYQVTLQSFNECSFDDTSFYVYVEDKPIVNLSPISDTCGGITLSPPPVSFQDNGNALTSYLWMINPGSGYQYIGGTDSSDAFPNIQFTAANNYILTAISANGCGLDSATTSFSIYPSPQLQIMADTGICMGDTVGITASVIGGIPPYTYQWNTQSSLSDSTIMEPTVFPTNTTTYQLIVTDANNCIATDNVTIIVYNLPVADAGADTTICEGTNAYISGSQSSGPGISFSWGPGIGSGSNQVVALSSPSYYYLTVTDMHGCMDIDTVFIDMWSKPTALASDDTAMCYGDSVLIYADSSYGSATPLSFNWNHGLGSGSQKYVSPNNSLYYVIEVTDTNTCFDRDSVYIQVNDLPVAYAGLNDSLCFGDTITIDASGSSGTAPLTYLWNQGLGFGPVKEITPVVSTKYAVLVTDSNQCSAIDTVLVMVNPLPNAHAGSNVQLCLGDSFLLDASLSTGNTPLSYNWDNGLGPGISHLVNPSTAILHTYIVEVTDANGCTNTDTALVKVNGLPTAEAGVGDTICSGTLTTVNAGNSLGIAPLSYTWDNGLGNGVSHVVQPGVSTTYVVTVTDDNGCTDSDSLIIYTNSVPYANAGPDTAICIHDSAVIDASLSSGLSPLIYTWNNSIGSGISHTVSPNVSTVYTVSVTDINGCLSTDYMTLTVYPYAPANAGANQEICDGKTIQLNGTGGINYQWSNGAVTDTSTVSPAATTLYFLTVTDGFGCVGFDSVEVGVNSNPIADAGPPQTICKGDSAVLTGSGGLNYNWSNGATTTATVVQPISFTTYTLTVTDANSCTATDQVSVSVNSLPTASAGQDTALCAGQPLVLDASLSSGFPTLSYTWNQGVGSGVSHTINPQTTANYIVTVTDGNGCENSDQILVIVHPRPTASAGPDQEICIGDSILLDASYSYGANPLQYLWDQGLGSGVSHNVQPALTTTYQLIVTDANNCLDTGDITIAVNSLPVSNAGSDTSVCYGDTITLDASASAGAPNLSYSWSQGAGYAVVVNVIPLTTTNYSLTVTDGNGCSSTDDVVVNVISLPHANAGMDEAICNQDMAVLDGTASTGAGTLTYGWNQGVGSGAVHQVFPSSDIVYTLLVTDTNNCEDSDQKNVYVKQLPVADFQYSNTCFGDLTQFSNLSAGTDTGIYSWMWDFDNGNNSFNQLPPSQTYLSAGFYQVSLIVEDLNTCKDTITKQVEIFALPEAVSQADTICYGQQTSFNDYSMPSTMIASWQWVFGDAAIAPYDTSTQQNPFFTYSSAGIYTVELQVTDTNGCIDHDTIQMKVDSLPNADFSAPNVPLYTATNFTDLSIPNSSAMLGWYWDFGDGNTSALQNPIHQYGYADTFDVILVVTNIHGCQDTIIKPVIVYPLPGANFLADSVCLGDTTHFTDLSNPGGGGTLQSWWWAFGDGDSALVQHPTHVYANYGTYAVSLIITDSHGGTDTIVDSVVVYANPIAYFVTDTVCNLDTTNFVDLSVPLGGTIITWGWAFGDGSGSSGQQNPVYLYGNISTITHYLATLEVLDIHGCRDVFEDSVLVYPLPVAAYTFDTVCTTDSTHFYDLSYSNGGNLSLWSWDFGDGSGASALSSPKYAYTQVFVKTKFGVELEVEDENGCKQSVSDSVLIYPLPVPQFTFDSVCSGDMTHFVDQSYSDGGIIAHWDWDFGDGIGSSAAASPNYTYQSVLAPVQFVVNLEVEDVNGCMQSGVDSVLVYPLPVAAFTFDTVCLFDLTQFTDLSYSIGSAISSWNWDFGDPVNNPNDTSDLQNPGYIYSYYGNYVVTLDITDQRSCANTISRTIIVDSLPEASFTATDVPLYTPTDFTDYSVPNSDSLISWFWDFGDGSISPQQNPAHLYLYADTFQVMLVVTNDHGCLDTIYNTAIVYPLPGADFVADSVCHGDSTHFTDLSQPPGSSFITSWEWDFDDGNASIDQHPVHLYINPGTYNVTLIVTDAFGGKDTTENDVIVHANPVAYFRGDSVCNGWPNSFVDLSIPAAASLNNWKWDFGDGSTVDSLANPQHIYAFSTQTEKYGVNIQITDTNGCLDSYNDTVLVYPSPFAGFVFDTACSGEFTNLTDTSYSNGGLITAWNWNFGYAAAGDTLAATTYQYPPTLSVDQYSVKLEVTDDKGCIDSVNQNITVLPLPVPEFEFDTACFGTPTHFHDTSASVSGSIASYEWNFGNYGMATNKNPAFIFPLSGSSFSSLVVADEFGCKDSVSKIILVDSLPIPDFYHSNPCVPGLMNFFDNSDPNGDSIVSWYWDFDDGYYAGMQNPYHYFTSLDTFMVTLYVFNTKGCADSVTFPVIVHPPLLIDFTYDTVCKGMPTTFHDSIITQGIQISAWLWDFGDGNSSSLPDPVHSYSMPGLYNVVLTVYDTNGCSESVNHVVRVYPNPESDYSVSAACLGDTTWFYDLSDTTGAPIISWQWDFGDGFVSFQQNPGHVYTQDSAYQVSLMVTDTNGCSMLEIKSLIVEPLPVAAFTYDTVCYGSNVTFVDSSYSPTGSITNWQWDFDDGTSSGLAVPPPHIYAASGTYNVELSVIDHKGCTQSVVHPITVFQEPFAEFNYNTPLCLGDTNFFTDLSNGFGMPVTKWEWSFGDGNIDTLQNPVHIYSQPGNYNVNLLITTFNGCVGNISKSIYVSAYPDVDFISNSSLCHQDSILFIDNTNANGTQLNTWYWDFGDGTNSSQSNPVHIYYLADTLDIKLVVDNIYGCADSNIQSVIIHPNPQAGFLSDTACLGDLMSFTDISTDSIGNIVSWDWDYGDQSNSSLQHPTHYYASNDTFIVDLVVHSDLGCDDLFTDTVYVYPEVQLAFFSDTVCFGDSTSFMDTLYNQGSQILNWDWDFGDGAIAANHNPQHAYYSPGQYNVYLTVKNNLGCLKTINNTIQVDTLPIANFSSDTVCFGDSTLFTDLSFAYSTNLVNWSWDFNDISNAPNDTSNNQHPVYEFAQYGLQTVDLEVIDGRGCRNVVSKFVRVWSTPMANFYYDTACIGNPTIFYDSSYNVNYSNIIAWDWDFGDFSTLADTSDISTPQYTYPAFGFYDASLSVKDINGCVDSTVKSVFVDSLPLAGFTYYSHSCPPGKVSFTDLSTGNGSNIVAWYWDFGGVFSNLQNPVYNFGATDTTYLVTLTITNNRGCSSTITDSVHISKPFVVDYMYDTVCFGDTTQFHDSLISPANTSIIAYLWDFGDGSPNVTFSDPQHVYPTPGVYTASMTCISSDSCIETVYHYIRVYPLPVADFTADTAFCNDSTYFTDLSLANGSPLSSWLWTFGQAASGSADTSFLQHPAHFYGNQYGVYQVTLEVTDSNACSSSITKEVLKQPCLEAGFSVTDIPNCMGYPVYFVDQSWYDSLSPGGIIAWYWDFGDGFMDSYSNFQDTVTHIYQNPGTYQVTLTITGSAGVSDSIEYTIQVYPNPTAIFSPQPQKTSIVDPKIWFIDQSVGNIFSWTWAFGDGDSAFMLSPNQYNPIHEYLDYGYYLASLLVIDSNGCFDTTSRRVIIDPDFIFYIPNAFTPNDDGVNDTYGPEGVYFDESNYVMIIYDRWGEQLYETHNYYNQWNGRFNRDICQQGTYIYLIKVRDVTGVWHQYYGYFFLIR